MDNKNGLVDYPGFDPDAKVVFPPTGPATDRRDSKNREAERKRKKPYSETYLVDPPTPDPSQTMPNQPDLRDPDTHLWNEEQIESLSPDPNWIEDPSGR